jgi:hypothetical protein
MAKFSTTPIVKEEVPITLDFVKLLSGDVVVTGQKGGGYCFNLLQITQNGEVKLCSGLGDLFAADRSISKLKIIPEY